MKLWQQPAHPLPVKIRPVGGETLISYIVRLADANDLARPGVLFRAVGEPTRPVTRAMIDDYDLALNRHSLRRLETLTATPATRLAIALPTLARLDATPDTIPATKPYRCWSTRPGCDHCTARLPGHPTIMVHPAAIVAICKQHRRWLGTTREPVLRQVDMTGAPEIITAHRRYARLRATTGDHHWLRQQLEHASAIARTWATHGPDLSPALHRRWVARGGALRPSCGPSTPTPALVFPETVALAEVLCDLHWRRRVAMAPNLAALRAFFHRVAARLGEPPQFAARTRYTPDDPLRIWVDHHRARHTQLRTAFWTHRFRHDHTETALPEIRHFK